MATFLIPRSDEPETLEVPIGDGGEGYISVEIQVPKRWTHILSKHINKHKLLEKKFSKLMPKVMNFVFDQRLDNSTKLFLTLLK